MIWRLIMVMPYRSKTQGLCNEAVYIEPSFLAYVPDLFKTQTMCNEAVELDPYTLWFIPDHLKCVTRQCVSGRQHFFLVPDHFKTQEMYIKAVEADPWQLIDVPDHLKHTKNVWKSSKGWPFFSAVSLWLVCGTRANRRMVWWRLLVSRWWNN